MRETIRNTIDEFFRMRENFGQSTIDELGRIHLSAMLFHGIAQINADVTGEYQKQIEMRVEEVEEELDRATDMIALLLDIATPNKAIEFTEQDLLKARKGRKLMIKDLEPKETFSDGDSPTERRLSLITDFPSDET